MRILTLADSIFEDKPGGSKVVARDVARRLAQRGHEVMFLVPKVKPDLTDEEEVNGYRVVRYGFRSPLDLMRTSARMFERLEREAPFDALHVHFAYAAFGVLRSPLSRSIPVLRHFYGPWSEESRSERSNGLSHDPLPRRFVKGTRLAAECWLKDHIEAFCLRRSNTVVALSNYSREQLRTLYHVPDGKISLIPGGVDTARFKPARDRRAVRAALDLPADRTLLLTVRRLVPRMGLDNLVLAMRKVAAQDSRVMLLIGGMGPLSRPLEELAQKNGLSEQVQFLGFIPDEQLPHYYQAADLFVLPTRALEGFGLITLEALACGTPVLGTPVGATPEILGQLGSEFLFADTSGEAIAEGICGFLRTHVDDEALRQQCAELVSGRFSWEAVTDQIEAILGSLVAHS